MHVHVHVGVCLRSWPDDGMRWPRFKLRLALPSLVSLCIWCKFHSASVYENETSKGVSSLPTPTLKWSLRFAKRFACFLCSPFVFAILAPLELGSRTSPTPRTFNYGNVTRI